MNASERDLPTLTHVKAYMRPAVYEEARRLYAAEGVEAARDHLRQYFPEHQWAKVDRMLADA